LGRKAHGSGRPTTVQSVKNPKTQLEGIDIPRRPFDIPEKTFDIPQESMSDIPRKRG